MDLLFHWAIAKNWTKSTFKWSNKSDVTLTELPATIEFNFQTTLRIIHLLSVHVGNWIFNDAFCSSVQCWDLCRGLSLHVQKINKQFGFLFSTFEWPQENIYQLLPNWSSLFVGIFNAHRRNSIFNCVRVQFTFHW